ncbi:MAG TPA: MaoC family dehydratase N-terminal domain-containing protein [Candidatus Dormibacteraeota bacterium]
MSGEIVGKKYDAVTFDTKKDHVAAFARAVGADPAAGVPPTYAFVGAFQTGVQMVLDEEAKVNLAMLVHGEQEFTWERHPEVGEALSATGTVASDEDRRGLRFLTLETKVADADGKPVLTSRMLNVIRG